MILTTALFPVLVARDLISLKSFYEEHFGFQTVFCEPSFYLHLAHPDRGFQLGFLVPDHPSQPDFLQQPTVSPGLVLSFEVDDAGVAYREAQTACLDIALALKEEPWGQRHFIVRDPSGFYVDIVQHVEAPTNP